MKLTLIFAAAFFLIAALTVNFIIQGQAIVREDNGRIILDIKNGMGFNEITEAVSRANLINSKPVFKIYSVLTGRAHQFKSGRYIFNGAVSIGNLTKILVNGPLEVEATIFPGMTLEEIDERLSESGVIEKGALEHQSDLEGFLFPDTYRFYPNFDAGTVIEKILKNFEIKIKPILSANKDLTFFEGNDNLYKLLIIASLLEKEIPNAEEQRIVAGIIEKRLKSGMLLQIDATVIYAKCREFLNCPTLKKEDYLIDSKYNTYRYVGLPPTPIGNPGIQAISSAINKKNSDYWYYLSDQKTKKTIFSKTLEEHNKNRKKYLN